MNEAYAINKCQVGVHVLIYRVGLVLNVLGLELLHLLSTAIFRCWGTNITSRRLNLPNTTSQKDLQGSVHFEKQNNKL